MKACNEGNGFHLRNSILSDLFLYLSFSTFALSIYSVSQYWNYQETFIDISKQLKIQVSDKDIAKEIEASILDANYDDARMYLDIAKSNGYNVNYQKYNALIKKRDTDFHRIKTQVTGFAEGFINGESSNLSGIAGSVTADFTVVGDVRDLHKEYTKYQQGKSVNELIVALSGVGIGLTALTVGTLGSAAPAKAGTSVIKLASKMKKITFRFQIYLVKLGRKVFDWSLFTKIAKQKRGVLNLRRAAKQAFHPEAMKPLQDVANSVNRIRKSSSISDTVDLLKYVESTDDLRRLEKVSLKHGTKTKGLFKLMGKTAIGTVRILRKTTALLLSILGSIISGLFTLSFLFKSS